VTPSLASFFWKDKTSADNWVYVIMRGCLPGMMIAVASVSWEKELARVVADILGKSAERMYANGIIKKRDWITCRFEAQLMDDIRKIKNYASIDDEFSK
jgi:hypothetical protein